MKQTELLIGLLELSRDSLTSALGKEKRVALIRVMESGKYIAAAFELISKQGCRIVKPAINLGNEIQTIVEEYVSGLCIQVLSDPDSFDISPRELTKCIQVHYDLLQLLTSGEK